MTRVYRFFVDVRIEGDYPPPMVEVAEHVATQVQDEDDHNLAVCVRPIEFQDFPDNFQTDDVPPTFGPPDWSR